MIYLIAAEGVGVCKIGYARNPTKRLDALQTASPHELTLLAVREGGQRLEALIHKAAEAFHVRGEWFVLNDAVSAAFRSVQERPAGRRTHSDIVRDVGPREMAELIGAPIHTVRSWAVRNSIPSPHWARLVQSGLCRSDELFAAAARKAA